MADLKLQPAQHDHKKFLEKASKRRGFSEAYEALEVEYALAQEMLAARARVGLTQGPLLSVWAPPRAPSRAWRPQTSTLHPWLR